MIGLFLSRLALGEDATHPVERAATTTTQDSPVVPTQDAVHSQSWLDESKQRSAVAAPQATTTSATSAPTSPVVQGAAPAVGPPTASVGQSNRSATGNKVPGNTRALVAEQTDHDEEPIRPGYYRAPIKAHGALLVAGSITGGTAYGLSLIAALYGTPELFVPIMGPWLAFHKMSSSCHQSGGSSDGMCISKQELDVADGMLQAAGAGLILAGLIVPKYRLLRLIDGSLQVQVAPLNFGRSCYGIGALGYF